MQNVRLYVNSSSRSAQRPFVSNTISPTAARLFYKFDRLASRLPARTVWRFLRACRPGDIAFLWPGVPINVYEQLKRRDVLVCTEMINSHTATAKRILDDAYERVGWPAQHGIAGQEIGYDRARLALADYIFSPSPGVRCSLLEQGVPSEKVLQTSRGWSPQRFRAGRSRSFGLQDAGPITLFVGRGCVRKGLHLLLTVWGRDEIPGKLILAGEIDAEIVRHFGAQLQDERIIALGHIDDISAVYQSADVMVAPSLEEGGPKVTYEAMASGLPVIVSPMGAGAIARDGKDGLVLDPYDEHAWVAALRNLIHNEPQRRQMSRNAMERARQFTWDKVAGQRTERLFTALNRKRSHTQR